MLAAGVIDPAKVTRVALENAASIAGMFLTTECVIAEKKEENPAPAMPNPGMGGMSDVCSLEEKQLDERLLITDYDEISNMLPTRTMQND